MKDRIALVTGASAGIGEACAVATGFIVPVDEDRDAVPDDFDNCLELYNPAQVDRDGNGVGDACQQFFRDSDGDGIPDHNDGCLFVPPAGGDPLADCDLLAQADPDGDGVVNADDFCPLNPIPVPDCFGDPDGDGVPNENDNCPDVPNADQAEAEPGLGVACAVAVRP